MAALLPLPEVQLIDANGKPMAGASIYTYIPSSSTPKATWSEPSGTALNTNPVITDSAGRAIMWGDGDYRVLVRDALGNQVYDQPSSTVVSAAMAPVVSAPTLADARNALGIDDAIAAEATIRASADSAEATTRANADTAETNARTSADAALQTNIDAERTRAEAAEADLQSQIDGGSTTLFRYGSGTTDGSGAGGVTFSPAFPAACDSVQMTLGGVGVNCTIRATGVSASGCTAQVEDTNNTSGVAAPFYWLAVGH